MVSYNYDKEGGIIMAVLCANEAAKYIISRCNDTNVDITNLKLQKMLYFLWIDYYNETGENLFDDSFYAWKLGPVIPSVYYQYHNFGADSIFIRDNVISFGREINRIMNNIIDKYKYKAAYDLVKRSHIEKGAWDTVYQNGSGDRKIIPFALIRDKGM